MFSEVVDRVLLRGGAAGIGETRIPAAHPVWQRESRTTAWPTIVFARYPVRIRQRGRDAVVADVNTAIFFNAEQAYTRAAIDPRGDHCDWIEIRPDVIADIVSRFDPRAADHAPTPFTVDHGPCGAPTFLRQRLNLLRARRPDADALEVEESALEIAAEAVTAAYSARGLARRALRATTCIAHRSIVEDVRALLADRLADGMSLSEIARAVHISAFHLCRIFRQHTGMTIHRYRDSLRLRAALEQVSEKSVGLAELGESLGYSSHSHFTAAFRREFGITPSEVRRAAALPSDPRPVLRAG